MRTSKRQFQSPSGFGNSVAGVLLGLMLLPPGSARCQQASSVDSSLVEYSYLSSGRLMGFYKVWMNPDGSMGSWFQYNDRGRGDSLRASWRTNERGFPISLDITGNDYYKNPIHESFSMRNGTARWENEAEKEEVKTDGNQIYVSLHGDLDVYASGVIRRALRTPITTLELLPSGQLRFDAGSTFSFLHKGSNLHLDLVRTSGVGISPSFAWYDASSNWFASVSDWTVIIRKGYEDLSEQLLKTQVKAQERYYVGVSRSLTETPGRGIALVHADLFDAEQGALLPGMTVLINKTIIADVGPDADVQVPEGYRVVDAKGKTVIPGLWDMHVHYGDPEDGLLHLAAGVTSVRDLGNSESLLLKKRQIDSGELLGPRIVSMAGLIDGQGPYAAPAGKIISTVDEGKEAVHYYAKAGYQRIKLYSSIKPEWVEPLASEAKRLGLGIGGHIPAFMTAEQAVNAGYEEIQHLNMLFLNFLGDTIDTRTPARFSLVAQYAASIDTTDKRVRPFVTFLRMHGTTIDPTIAVFEDLFTSRPGKPSEGTETILPRLPLQLQRMFRTGQGFPVLPGMDSTYRRSFQSMLHLVLMLFNAHVPIVAGTDGFAGFTLHRELELYAEAGIPPADVLRIATYGAARAAGKENELGSIRRGKLADLVLIDGNPLTRMSDIRRTELVIKDGKILDPRKLYKVLSIKPAF